MEDERRKTGVERGPGAWKVLRREPLLEARPWLEVFRDTVRLPEGTVVEDFHTVWMPDYVAVVALVAGGRVVLERQYKHGAGRVVETLPTGMLLPGEPPLEAARRELLEETGLVSDDWSPLGRFVVNGNRGCGTAHFFMARGCRRAQEPCSGDLETMELVEAPLDEALARVLGAEAATLSTAAGLALALAKPSSPARTP